MRRRYGARLDTPAVARRRMVYQHLRGRDIRDERVLEAMANVPARALRPRAAARPGVRRRGPCDRARPDDLAAVHGRAHLRGARAARRRARARRRHRVRLPGRRAGRAGGGGAHDRARARSSPSRRARHSPRRATTGSSVHVGDGTLGLPEHAPYTGIAVAAAAPELPQTLYEQLEPRGRLVVPVGRLGRQELAGRRAEPRGAGRRPLRALPLRPARGRGGLPGGRRLRFSRRRRGLQLRTNDDGALDG